MPIPHEPNCPCLRCSNRRKAEFNGLVANSSVGRACAVMKKAASWPKAPVEQDKFSTRPAPGPKGPPTAELLGWAKARRRAEEEERERTGR